MYSMRNDLSTKRLINRALNRPRHAPMLRCHAKNRAFVKACEERGDYSHSAKDHICDECRCKHVAGWGTNHYGVGFCKHHEKGRNKVHAREFAKNQALALQQGWPMPHAYESANEYLQRIAEESKDAREVLDTRAEITLLRAKLQEFEAELSSGKRKETELAKQIAELIEKLDGLEFIDGKQGDEIKELLEQVYLKETQLTTGSPGGKLRPMSYKARAELAMSFARTISGLAKDWYGIVKDDFIQVEEVTLWLQAIVLLTKRIMNDNKMFQKWLNEFKLIPRPVSPAERRVAQKMVIDA